MVCTVYNYSKNLLRQTDKDPQNEFLSSDVILIRISLLYIHYYRKPNDGRKLVLLSRNLF